ncbi:MAG: hypothetical protein ABEJ42_03405 [Halobacteriaceae archaeon]
MAVAVCALVVLAGCAGLGGPAATGNGPTDGGDSPRDSPGDETPPTTQTTDRPVLGDVIERHRETVRASVAFTVRQTTASENGSGPAWRHRQVIWLFEPERRGLHVWTERSGGELTYSGATYTDHAVTYERINPPHDGAGNETVRYGPNATVSSVNTEYVLNQSVTGWQAGTTELDLALTRTGTGTFGGVAVTNYTVEDTALRQLVQPLPPSRNVSVEDWRLELSVDETNVIRHLVLTRVHERPSGERVTVVTEQTFSRFGRTEISEPSWTEESEPAAAG